MIGNAPADRNSLESGYRLTGAGNASTGKAVATRSDVTVVGLAELEQYRQVLAELAGRATDSNVFFEPAVLDAALKEDNDPEQTKLVLVWEGDTQSRLLGMLPVRTVRHHWGPGSKVLFGWKHDFGIRGTPLIAPGSAQIFWAHTFDAIRAAGLPRYLILPTVSTAGECFNGLRAAVLGTGRYSHVIGRETHIVMEAGCDGEAYLKQAMSARRYKRMQKNRRDLQKQGKLESRLYTEPGDVMLAFRRFVEMEAAGWKGRENGAIMCKPDALRFFLRTICDFAIAGRVRVDSLELDGRSIGMSIIVVSGHTAYCWKTTFDERFAKYSPGMLTVMDVSRGIASDQRVTFADSCTNIGHSLMGSLWTETADAVDVLVDLKPDASAVGFKMVVALETARGRGRAKAKKIYQVARASIRSVFSATRAMVRKP